jgi:hypothetical protein
MVPEVVCKECGHPLGYVAVRYSAGLIEKVCLGCGLAEEVESPWIRFQGGEIYGRSPVHHAVFGKNLGTVGGFERTKQTLTTLNHADGAIQQTSPEAAVEFWRRRRELENFLPPGGETPTMRKTLETFSRRIYTVQTARRIKIPEVTVDNMAKLVRKGFREASELGEVSRKVRESLVEWVLMEEGYWPP